VAAEIADGFRAYTIKVSDVTGVGGHALPGDRVDVVLTRDLTPQGPVRSFVSEVVLQDVRVLGVDLNADLSANKPATPSTATLEVNVPDTQKLSMASDLGKLSLALRKTGSTELARTAPMRAGAFVSGGAPAAPRAVSSGPRRSVAPEGPRLIIIVADETKGGSRASHARKPAAPPAPPAPAQAASNTGSIASATNPA
jgi:pilus assembly protein CpaB